MFALHVFADFLQGVSIVLEVLPLHDQRPDVAGVIDHAIDLVVKQRLKLDPLACSRPAIDLEARLLKATREYDVEDMLLGKGAARHHDGLSSTGNCLADWSRQTS